MPSDNPIRDADQDRVGRAPIAQAFADQILALDVSEGAVVGVLAPWGYGKTSFINLTRTRFIEAGVEVLDFNPWMFSGVQQLVDAFFIELAAQLKLRPGLAAVGAEFASYGELLAGFGWVPLVGPWLERVRGGAKLANSILNRRKEGVVGRREKLTTALRALDHPVVVVLDDIDRLTTEEIRHIFKLVRLTASFPKIVYVLAFDRARVEAALQEQGIPGRAYLEKILQLAFDLPAIPEEAITQQILETLSAVTDDIENQGRFDEVAWPDVFMEVIRPLITNMRDVRRYAMAVRGTVMALGGEIALVDVLGLEAIRVFRPQVFETMQSEVEALTATTDGFLAQAQDPRLRGVIESLAEQDDALVRAAIRRLFPAASRHLGGTHYGGSSRKQWLRDHRVAHRDILRLYLERFPTAEFSAFKRAEEMWPLLADYDTFAAYLSDLTPEQRRDLVEALETFEGKFTPDQVVPATAVLLNAIPLVASRPTGMFDLEPRHVVGRVVLRLLRTLEDASDVETAAVGILEKVESLSSRFDLITDLGYRENAGHQLVSEEAANRFESDWLKQVTEASPEQLEHEWDLLRIAYFARAEADQRGVDFAVPDDPRVTFGLLKAADIDSRSQTIGNRAVHRSRHLQWETLEAAIGGPEVLARRIAVLKESGLASEEPELMALTERYLGGWRPPRFSRNQDSD